MKGCIACARGFHAECLTGCKKCHKKNKNILVVHEEKQRVHGSTASGLKDPKSTGRKRAALVYPLDKDADCEWRNKRNCGGGKRPIIGCLDGRQQHRHHGPVKDTTRNIEENVHRICSSCHNHWHELNDLIYDAREYALLPHDPQDATIEEIAKYQLTWITGEMGRKYELASSKNRLDSKS